MTMREKIARAIEAAAPKSDWPTKADRLKQADAVLAAMREPTEDMLRAMHEAMFVNKFDGTNLMMLGAGFEAAIDAARLKTAPTFAPPSAPSRPQRPGP